MLKIKITIGRIITWASSFMLLLGVFGDWYGDFIGSQSISIFGAWDLAGLYHTGFDGGFLGFLAILILLASVAVVFFDLFEQSKLSKFISLGVAATVILVFIIALVVADGEHIAYGLVLLLFGGLGMPVGPLLEDIMSGKLPFGGGTAQTKKFCSNCGAQVADNAPFCTSCGNRMN